MTKDERNDFKTIFIEALNSKEGQNAIVSALQSDSGQKAIEKASLSSLKSKEAEDILLDYFLKAFREVVLPGLDSLQDDVNILKDDFTGMAIDLKYFKQKEARTEKYVQDLREKVFRRRTT